VPRKDAVQKVTGEALYIDDYSYEGMLYAAAVRSPHPRIRIRSLSDSKAKKISGFVTLVTTRDIPGKNAWPLVTEDYPFLPGKESRFAGETLALTVAETPEAAARAAQAVEVDFTELPHVTDPFIALGKNSVKLHGPDNVFSRYVIQRGEAALVDSDVMVEGTFSTSYQVHGYLETQGAIAFPEPGGSMTVYGSMQCPFYVVDAVAQALGIGHHQVRIVQRTIGGAFGGKEDVPALVAAHAALAARKTGRPVKLIYSRREDFLSMSRRHPSWTRISYGAKEDGSLTACRVRYVLDAGAYSTLSPIVLWRGAVHAAGPYRIPNVFIEAYAVATNKAPCGAFRGFGQPQVCFANESLIDELALKLGMDPLEFRIKNALREGDRTATGQVLRGSCGLEEALVRVREASGWSRRKRQARRSSGKIRKGIGVSANFYGVGLGARGRILDRAGAQVQVLKDGTVLVSVGNTEMGQGSLTVLAQICAEALNAPYEAVRITEVDTSRVPDSGPTVASRTTLMSGNAILNACEPLKERLWTAAKELLVRQGSDIQSEMQAFSGRFRIGTYSVGFAEAAKECWQKREKMAEHGWYAAAPTSFDARDGQGDAYSTYAWSANVAETEVDMETGEVRVQKVTSAHDLGRVINPMTAEGQVEGGVLQGIGYALNENLVYRDGILLNPNFTDYHLPSTAEAPEFKTILLEHGYGAGPYAAKGFGETPLIGVAPAVANAVCDATGVRMPQLPMIPETVWSELKKNAEDK